MQRWVKHSHSHSSRYGKVVWKKERLKVFDFGPSTKHAHASKCETIIFKQLCLLTYTLPTHPLHYSGNRIDVPRNFLHFPPQTVGEKSAYFSNENRSGNSIFIIVGMSSARNSNTMRYVWISWLRVATIGFHRLKILKTKWKNIYVKSAILFKLIVAVQSEQNNSCAGSSRPLAACTCDELEILNGFSFFWRIPNEENGECTQPKLSNWNYGMERRWICLITLKTKDSPPCTRTPIRLFN